MKTLFAVLFLSIFLLPGVAAAEKPKENKEFYYVTFKEKAPKKFETSNSDVTVVKNEGGKIQENFKELGISTVELTEKQAEKLRKKKNIQSVEKIPKDYITATGWEENRAAVGRQTDAYVAWEFSSSETRYSEEGYKFSDDIGFTGKGVNIAVIDSGVAAGEQFPSNLSESNIKARIDCSYDISSYDPEGGEKLEYTNQDVDPSKCRPTEEDIVDSHGTTVTEVIVGKHGNQTDSDEERYKSFQGVAPDANIYSINVYGKVGYLNSKIASGSDDWVRAFNWIIKHNITESEKEKISLVNMSQTRHNPYSYVEAEEIAINRLYDMGVIVVTGTGNEGMEIEIGYPAKYANTITVGAINTYDGLWNEVRTYTDGEKVVGTQIGPEVDIVAPGVNFTFCVPIEFDTIDEVKDGFRTGSGTSYSVPMVVGALALLKEQFPYATNNELKWMLYSKANRNGGYEYLDFPSGRYDLLTWNPEYGYGQLIIGNWEQVENSDQTKNPYGNDRNLIYEIKSDQTVFSYPSEKAPQKKYGKNGGAQLLNYWGYGKGTKNPSDKPRWAQLKTGEWVKKEDMEPGRKFTLWNNSMILGETYSNYHVPASEVTVMANASHWEPYYVIDEYEYQGKKVSIPASAGTFQKIETVNKKFMTMTHTVPYKQPTADPQPWDIMEFELPEIITVDREWTSSSDHTWYRVKVGEEYAWLLDTQVQNVDSDITTLDLKEYTPYYESHSTSSTQKGTLEPQTVTILAKWIDETGQKWYQIETWTGPCWIQG